MLKREPSNNDKLMASQNQTYALQQLLYCLKLKMGDVQSTFDTTNKRYNIMNLTYFNAIIFNFQMINRNLFFHCDSKSDFI